MTLEKGKNFSEKTVIVTGATSGIGKEIAKALVKNGANLIISGRNLERGEKLSAQLGESAYFIPGDIKIPDTNQTLVKEALSRFNGLNHLVLSAGELGIGKIHELEIETWHNTIASNLNAVFYLLKYAIPEIIRCGGGSIVIIGSVAGLHAFPNHPAYSASKGALPALVKQIARDYGPDIRVNLLSPAQVETPLLLDSVKAFENPESILQQTANSLPMKRIGLPSDIAEASLFLLSDKASWITGTNFIVDGGFLST